MDVEHKLKIQSFFFFENKAEILNVWRLDIGPKDVKKTGQAFCLPSDQSRSSWPFKHIILSHSQGWILLGPTPFYFSDHLVTTVRAYFCPNSSSS